MLGPEDIIELYSARFAIEGYIHDLTTQMEWEDYQKSTTSGFYRFVNLTCLDFGGNLTVAVVCIYVPPYIVVLLVQKKSVSWSVSRKVSE